MDHKKIFFNFLFEIDGVGTGRFSECSGLSKETEIIKHRAGADEPTVMKLPGIQKFSSITLKRGIFENEELLEWCNNVITEYGESKNGLITLIDETREHICKWRIINARPTKLLAHSRDATTTEVVVDELEISFEGFIII